jgi:hypothetical protein
MSFASMHNDYLDPDRAGINDEDWGLDLDEIKKILKTWCSGRWDWAKIDYCLTGKDADLGPWGQQGLQLLSADEDGVHFIVHGYSTVIGTDVCLNYPWDEPEGDDYYKARDCYMNQMQEFVMGAASMGEWDGDSWGMSCNEETSVPWVYLPDEVTPDYEATCHAIIAKLEEVIKPWEQEMIALDHWGNVLAGWTDDEGNCIKEGDQTPQAAWAYKGELE